MENEKIIINGNPGTYEVVLREGKSIDPKEPNKISISGILNSPANFLKAKTGVFTPIDSHLLVDKQNLKITFVANERDFYKTEISGSLKPAKILGPFNINNDGKFKNTDLAKLLRRHPFLFEDKEAYNKLIIALLNFSATIQTVIESNQDQRGNMKNLIEKTVSQKIPESIKFKAPIFEGEDELTFEVFLCCEATSNAVEFYLDSPELYLLQESEKNRLLGIQAKVFEDFGCAVIYI